MKGLAIVLLFTLAAPSTALAVDNSTQAVITRVEANVTKFLDLFSEVKCTELVEQTKLNAKGKVEHEERGRFDYLLMSQTSGGDLSLEESRLQEQATPHKKNVPLLVTNGFATLVLVFHPYYQGGFEFSTLEPDLLNGHSVVKIRFRHVKGMRTPTVLMLRGREYPLDMMGTAWINPDSGVIERIQAELLSNMEDIGLRRLSADVIYAPPSFPGMGDMPWLASLATIEVETPKQHWRNVHRFTNYKHFAVDTQHSDNIPGSLKETR
jgi:hypothetical protein